MRVKKIKRKCMVSGCKNIVTYHITKRNELGNSVHICPDCLREAVELIDNAEGVKAQPADGFICSFCGREFKSEAGLKRHIKAVHADV